jgi:DNA-binding transcriptional MerR regulator
VSANSQSPTAKQATRSIRDVLELLSVEFPDVTVSKIRFLESRGLIHPERSASGYRKFCDEDIERLRWILRQQKENFLPLKVIKGRLDQAGTTLFTQSLFESVIEESAVSSRSEISANDHFDDDDFNQDPEDPPTPQDASPGGDEEVLGNDEATNEAVEDKGEPRAGGPAGGGPREPRRPAQKPARQSARAGTDRRSAEALAKSARVDVAFIAELEAFSLIEGDGEGESRSYPEESVRVVELAARLRGYGIEPRHLRTFKHAAERESGVIEQVVMPMLQRRNPEAQKRAKAVLEELVATAAQFHDTFVRASLREIDTR